MGKLTEPVASDTPEDAENRVFSVPELNQIRELQQDGMTERREQIMREKNRWERECALAHYAAIPAEVKAHLLKQFGQSILEEIRGGYAVILELLPMEKQFRLEGALAMHEINGERLAEFSLTLVRQSKSGPFGRLLGGRPVALQEILRAA